MDGGIGYYGLWHFVLGSILQVGTSATGSSGEHIAASTFSNRFDNAAFARAADRSANL